MSTHRSAEIREGRARAGRASGVVRVATGRTLLQRFQARITHRLKLISLLRLEVEALVEAVDELRDARDRRRVIDMQKVDLAKKFLTASERGHVTRYLRALGHVGEPQFDDAGDVVEVEPQAGEIEDRGTLETYGLTHEQAMALAAQKLKEFEAALSDDADEEEE